MKQYLVQYIMRLCLLLIALLGIFTLPVHAAVPDDLNYQGYLTNSSGSPINGTVFINFSLYNVETGGIALWSDIRSVNVTNGLFSVTLGGTASPFPLGLFDDPLWLGIDVSGDGEMTPRAAISSAAFAHKADDALTLQGQSASFFDQSAHVTDTSNPHNVTAAQVGAATPTDIATHAANASAHHSKTTSFTELTDQAGDTQIPSAITRDSELTAHSSNPAAHHSRYTDIEAVNAMGIKTDTNPLHHDKRTDNEVLAAVLGQDGAGSNLDADLVDGLQASEIIDAASDEIRIPISSVPITITTSGSYYFTEDLTYSLTTGQAIAVNVDNVTIDLMGFSLIGPGIASGSNYGIYMNGRRNVTIRNGTVRAFGEYGIMEGSYVTGRDHHVLNMRAIGNGSTGIFLYGRSHLVKGCTAAENGDYGILTDYGSVVIHNTVNDNQSFGLYAYGGTNITDNTAYNNQGGGFYIRLGATVTGNSAITNVGDGFYTSSGSTVNGNTAYNNQGNGISASLGSTIINNTSYHNYNTGILLGSNSLVNNNTAYNNNQSGDTYPNMSSCVSCTFGLNHAP